MAFTPAEVAKMLSEALDPRTTFIICQRHGYVPGGLNAPTPECSDCWFAYLLHTIAVTPPHLRQEKLDELEMVLRTATELEDQGQFDFKLYARPRIEITKGNA